VSILCGFGDINEIEKAGTDLITENISDLVGYLPTINGS
jgi:hypothetical protein